MEEKRDAFSEWATVWPKCLYRIKEEPSGSPLGNLVKGIVAVQDSDIEWYAPLAYGRGTLYDTDYIIKSYQPAVADSDDWPPHLALARLNLEDEKAIIRFTSRYGLLGLRYIPSWASKEPFMAESRIHKNLFGQTISDWYNVPSPENKPPNWHPVKTFSEPLELFRNAAQEYQKNISLLVPVDDEAENLRNILDFQYYAGDYLVTKFLPQYEKGQKLISFQSKSLLEYCYIRAVSDYTEGSFRHCKRPQCNRIFIARYESDVYCSGQCRRSDTVANTAIRVLKKELREKLNSGEITKLQWRKAVEEAERLYKEGIKDKDTLSKAVHGLI